MFTDRFGLLTDCKPNSNPLGGASRCVDPQTGEPTIGDDPLTGLQGKTICKNGLVYSTINDSGWNNLGDTATYPYLQNSPGAGSGWVDTKIRGREFERQCHVPCDDGGYVSPEDLVDYHQLITHTQEMVSDGLSSSRWKDNYWQNMLNNECARPIDDLKRRYCK
jgi:hypothetical protein